MIIYFSGKLYIFSKFNSTKKEKLTLSIWLSKTDKFELSYNEVRNFLTKEDWTIFNNEISNSNKKTIKKCMKNFIDDINKKMMEL